MTKELFDYVTRKHGGQVDKAGKPYALHLMRVADTVPDGLRHVAFAHDVLEDTDATEQEMLEAGFSHHDVFLVKLLTHKDGIPYDDYLDQVLRSKDAILIKVADITDNLKRLHELDKDTQARLKMKYIHALQYMALTGYSPSITIPSGGQETSKE